MRRLCIRSLRLLLRSLPILPIPALELGLRRCNSIIGDGKVQEHAIVVHGAGQSRVGRDVGCKDRGSRKSRERIGSDMHPAKLGIELEA